MTAIHKSAIVPYSAEQMFKLVNDVGKYSEFLPWCHESTVIEETETFMKARLTIQKGPLSQSFTTVNKLIYPHSIHMSLEEGAFKTLDGAWSFHSLGESGCRITFDLKFQFTNSVMSMVLTPIFSGITGSLVQAFCKRAKSLLKDI